LALCLQPDFHERLVVRKPVLPVVARSIVEITAVAIFGFFGVG